MDDGVILQPDDSQKNDPKPADPNAANPTLGIAKNAPGFDEPDTNNNEDRVFEITADNISPIKEDTAIPAVPISTIVAKQRVIRPTPPPAPQPVPQPIPQAVPVSIPVVHQAPAPVTPPTAPVFAPPVAAPVAPAPAPVAAAPVPMPPIAPATASPVAPTLPTRPGSEPPPVDIVAPVHTAPVRVQSVNPAALPDMAPRRQPAYVPTPPPPPRPPQAPAPAPVSISEQGEPQATPVPLRRLDPNLPRDPNIKPLRTYESDVAEALARERTSMTTMAVAEAQKKQKQQQVVEEQEEEVEDEPTTGTSGAKKVLLLLLSLCFIGAGVIGAYYLYSKSPLAPPTPVAPDKPAIVSLITSDSFVLMPIDNLNAISLKTRVQREMEKAQPEGSIMEIVPTKSVDGQTMRVTAAELIALMDIEVPDILLRSLGQPAMLGMYTPPRDTKSIFAVVTTEFFQNTFAGMLQWESVMADDLKFFLFPDTVRGVANTTSQTKAPAQTGGEGVTPLLTIRGKFVDRIIKNKDVREFISEDGRVLFLYSFVDNNKLVITDKEDTLAEILTRLEKAASIR